MIGIVSPRAAVFWSCVLLSLAAAAAPAPTCTSQNIRGFPISGRVCGGSTHAMTCSAGAIYDCKSGPVGQQDNCTLVRACPIGCQTGPTSGNIVDSCWSGADPLTLSTTNTLGGNDVGFNLTLSASHTGVAYTHMSINRGDLVPGSYCAVPDLQPGVSSVNFALPTAVVPSATDVTLHSFVSWTDPSGSSHELVSNEAVLTLNGGGKEPPTPAIASFALTPSSIAQGGTSFMDVRLTRMAPARGVSISVSSSNPSVASVIPNGQPTVLGGCTEGGGAATISAASSVPRATTVSISATSGDPAHTVIVSPLTVTP